MSEKVDVLAVLKEFAFRKNPFGSTEEAQRQYQAAVDAVTELVESIREQDSAYDEFQRAWSPQEIALAANAFAIASNRRTAALARFGGEP